MNPVCGCAGNCGCGTNCAGCCGACNASAYGFFTQNGCLNISAGGIIPFSGCSTAVGVCQSGGVLTLEEPGVYMVTLGVTIPENDTLDTALNIRLDGTAVPGGAIVIDKNSTDAPLHASTQTVVNACAGSVVTVPSTDTINITTECGDDPIATLTIVKIA